MSADDDPASDRDLHMIPTEDLVEWLRIERNVMTDYLADGIGEPRRDQRARWASGRARRIESELLKRSQRLPKQDA